MEKSEHRRGAPVEDGLSREAHALSAPNRVRIVRYLARSPEPVSVADLTQWLGLNHNGVRQHLAVLVEAGLVVEEVEDRATPGRPRLFYRLGPVAPSWASGFGPYAWLAGLLSGALRRGLDSRQAGRQEGHRIAAEAVGEGEAIDLFEAEMSTRGFEPEVRDRGGSVEVILGRCPFAEVAAADPVTVCQLHLGLAEGLAEGLGGLSVERLVPKNPYRARCRLILSRRGD